MSASGPVPLFNNPPIMPENFISWRFFITNITLGATTLVTLSIPSVTYLNYSVGQLIRLLIPPQFGCRQLNNQTGYVLELMEPNQVVLNIDSRGGDPFVSNAARTQPQTVPVGDINSGQINNNGTQSILNFIPGSFQNIS